MKNSTSFVCRLSRLLFMGSLASTAAASIINVDIDARTSDSNASRQGIAFSGQGAYADSGNNYWNSISTASRAISGLIASDGTSTTPISISVSGGDGYVDTALTNYLLCDYFYGTTTTTISGLEPNATYTLYVYAVGDNPGQGSTITIGTENQETTGENGDAFMMGGNYVVFMVNANASGEIDVVSSDKMNGLQLIGDVPEPVYNLVHPGMSHNQADLDRMKYQVEAHVEPWYSSYQNMCTDSKASYDYSVQGNVTNRVVYRDSPRTNKSAWESDSRAAYYNALRWIVEGDTRYANKAVEIFNTWNGLTYVQHSGTKTLTGSMVYVMLEAAEIIKSTYSGWSAVDQQAFGDMLVYPGWSGTQVPDKLDLAYEDGGEGTWYWRVYEGDHRRAGNQELSGWRACMAIGIFLDNKIIYDRAQRYIAGLSHRPDDLAYQPGPTFTDSVITNTPYNIAYNSTQYTDIEDWGYDGVLTNYVLETGQCGEAARDQGHCSWGLSCLESIASMAWTQGDDIWGLADQRLLLGLEYHTRYNLSYLQTYPDQLTPWEPTVASGEFISTLNRCARTKCLAINPYMEYDYERVSRGAVTEDQWELPVAHYVGCGFADAEGDAKWITRTRDYNIAQSGYEEADGGGAQIGWGALTFRRPDFCYGDPISGIVSNVPTYAVHPLPGTLEAELYDYSQVNGEGRTFHDASEGNSGNEFRTDGDVDITTCSEGGYALTDLEEGEWVSYTVYINASGSYNLTVRYATEETASVRIALGGQDVTGDVLLPATGGADIYADHTIAGNLSMAAGVQSLRIYFSKTSATYRFKRVTLTATETITRPSTRIEAESCDAQDGVKTNDSCSDEGGGYNVGSISDGDWCRYDGITGAQQAIFSARIARPAGKPDSRIEVHIGATNGTMVGFVDVPETGGWQDWNTVSTTLDSIEGAPALYLVFVQTGAGNLTDMMNFNWFELTPPETPDGLAAAPSTATQIDLQWNAPLGVSGYNIKRSQESGGPYEVQSIGPASTQFTDSGLQAGTNYFYVISALYNRSESTNSLEVSAIPSAPLNAGDVVIGPVQIEENGSGNPTFNLQIEHSQLGHQYQVFTTENLTNAQWQVAGKIEPGTGETLQLILPIETTQTNLFYKVEAARQ